MGRYPKKEVSEETWKEWALSGLTTRQLAEKYNMSQSLISREIKQYRPAKLTDAQRKEIINSQLSNGKLAEKYKCSVSLIAKIKQKAGVNVGQGRTILKKERTTKPKAKTELPIQMKKKISPVAKSQFEVENERKLKAEKSKEDYHDIQALQKRLGYRYVTRIGKMGIKETVWTNK